MGLARWLVKESDIQATRRVTGLSELWQQYYFGVGVCNSSKLCVPVASDSFTLYTDTSGRDIGAVLSVTKDDGVETPTAYYSRQLQKAELRHSATELEALAVVAAVIHFLPLLYGRSLV